MTGTILVVDNYDSFVYTLVGYLTELGATCTVARNDAVPDDVTEFAGVLVSPGPGTPRDAGRSIAVIEQCAGASIPMLGVCLGHQALAEAMGATVSHAPQLRHGKTSLVEHDGTGVFAGLPSPLTVGRYHSLAVEAPTVPPELVVTARTEGVVMGLAHRTLPLHGVQFHPESVLTEGGYRMVANWLELAGLAGAVERAEGRSALSGLNA